VNHDDENPIPWPIAVLTIVAAAASLVHDKIHRIIERVKRRK